MSQDTIISLLDLEGPFFDNISENRYSTLQRYISGCVDTTRILWVTKETQISCEDPRFSLVLGFARTMRYERGLDFGTFEIDRFDSVASDALVTVYEKFKNQKRDSTLNPEYEFALHDGTVHIGRFHWMSLPDQLLAAPDKDAPKKLSIGAYGVMDTLQWIQVEQYQLEKDQVEVDIQYIGLNFRVCDIDTAS